MPPSPQPSATPRDGRSSPTVSVVIPADGDAAGLPHVLRALPPVDEVIVVGGGTETLAVPPGTRIVRPVRPGPGHALACGVAAGRGDVVVTLPADGTADPGDIPRFVSAVRDGADVAHGTRGGGTLLGRLTGTVTGVRCTDPTWGYRAYRRAVLPVLDLPGADVPGLRRGRRAWGDGPEIGPLVVVRAALAGLRVVEVAGVGHPRLGGSGRDGLLGRLLLVLRTLFVEFRRRRARAGTGRPAVAAAGRGTSIGTAEWPELSPGRGARGWPGGRSVAGDAAAVVTGPWAGATPLDGAGVTPGSGAGLPPVSGAGVTPASGIGSAPAGGRHSAPAGPGGVPGPRRGPLPSGLPVTPPPPRAAEPAPPAAPSGLPSNSARPSSPAAPFRPLSATARPSSPAGPPSHSAPAAPAGPSFPAWSGPADRRRGYPVPRPGRPAREPGAHRTLDITEYDTGVRRGRLYDTGAHHRPDDDPDDGPESRRSGLYDTGVHRVGVYDSGVHRTDVYDTGAHHLPEEDGPMYRRSAPRDVGGGRRRLDARDRGTDGRPDLTVIPGEGGPGPIRGGGGGRTAGAGRDGWRGEGRARDARHTDGHGGSRDARHTDGQGGSREARPTDGQGGSRDARHTHGQGGSRATRRAGGRDGEPGDGPDRHPDAGPAGRWNAGRIDRDRNGPGLVHQDRTDGHPAPDRSRWIQAQDPPGRRASRTGRTHPEAGDDRARPSHLRAVPGEWPPR